MPNDAWSLLGMLAAVLAILALAYFVTRWIAGYGGPAVGRAAGARDLSILSRLAVGKNEQLLLVRLHSRCLLLGVTAGGITVLTELTEEECAQWTKEQGDAVPASFAQALKNSLPKKK